ncbi:MAG: hypothetical protein JW963_18645 [Anaerolineales bacterium]|nr:hypothetical protein [Anaerolineales bacterium]
MSFLPNALISGFGDKLAYLDPGSGSFLLQLLIAALLGAGIALRASWSKVKRLFGIKPEVDEDAEDEEANEQ